jgi:type VI protein secretion system component VasF
MISQELAKRLCASLRRVLDLCADSSVGQYESPIPEAEAVLKEAEAATDSEFQRTLLEMSDRLRDVASQVCGDPDPVLKEALRMLFAQAIQKFDMTAKEANISEERVQ